MVEYANDKILTELLKAVSDTTRRSLFEANLKRVSLVENWIKELKSIWELRLEKLDEIMKDGGTQND